MEDNRITCEVCGEEYSGMAKCPVCGYPKRNVIGSLSKEQLEEFDKRAKQRKEQLMKNIKVYIRGYHWEEENGQLIEKFHEDILIGENLQNMNIGQTSYSEVVFAKQAAGEDVELTVVVENEETKVHEVIVTAPDTEKMWNVGFSLKKGLKGTIKVGAGNNLAESKEFSLKG